MLPLPLIQAATRRGVSLVCATCRRFEEGRAQGLSDDRCTVREPCTGPFAGGTFPGYAGPLSDFTRWCLRCGHPASAAIRVVGTDRAFGLCESHLRDSLALAPVEGVTHHLLEVLRPRGVVQVQSMERLPRPFTRRSVGELLAEITAELAERGPS